MTNPSEAPMANAIDDVKLLPCPFCGGEKLKLLLLGDDRAYRCEDCRARGPTCLTNGDRPYEQELPQAWNRRASTAPSQHTGWSDEAVALRNMLRNFADQVEVLLSADDDMPTAQADYDATEEALERVRAMLAGISPSVAKESGEP